MIMTKNSDMGEPTRNFRASARLFRIAVSQAQKSAATQVDISKKNEEEVFSRETENSTVCTATSLGMFNDEYSLPLTVGNCTLKSLSDPSLGFLESHVLPVANTLSNIYGAGLETDDDDYSLPVFGPQTSVSRLYARDLASVTSCDYDLPLTSPSCKDLLPSKSDSFDGPISDASSETREIFEKELPESSAHRYRENGGCTDCEAEEKFHRLRSNFKESYLPRYNPKQILTMKLSRGFIDSHCHIDFLFKKENFQGTFSDYRMKHQESFPDSYEGCVAVFCDPSTFIKKCVWQKILMEDNVWAAFGCHPKRAHEYSDRRERSLLTALAHPRVKALGEIGLDYSKENKFQKAIQQRVFRSQLKIALYKQLPLVIHCREAHEDTLDIMKEMLPRDYKIHLHCFTDVWKHAKEWLDTFPNLFIGITNLVTFSSARSVHQVVKNIPLDRLLVETDAPYFVPRSFPKRTESSHPGMALHVAAQVAALRGDSLEKVVYHTRENTYQVYGI